jgi:hypothetical protein
MKNFGVGKADGYKCFKNLYRDIVGAGIAGPYNFLIITPSQNG